MLDDLFPFFWLGLCASSLGIIILGLRRRGFPGVCFGLVSMLGAVLCIFLYFGLAVAFEDPGGPFQGDALFLNGVGLSGLALFVAGARFALDCTDCECTGNQGERRNGFYRNSRVQSARSKGPGPKTRHRV